MDNLVFLPAWLLKINFVADRAGKVYFNLTALCGKAPSVTSSVVCYCGGAQEQDLRELKHLLSLDMA